MLGSINLVTPGNRRRRGDGDARGELSRSTSRSTCPTRRCSAGAPYAHHVVALNRNEMDDHLDLFHPQGSTQWDALDHVRCREHGFWGGRTQNPTEGPNGLGIHHWAEHGIAGRGVLIDLAGRPRRSDYDPLGPAFTAAEVEATLAAEGVEPRARRHLVRAHRLAGGLPGARCRRPAALRRGADVRRAARRRGHRPH